ncbi:MAG: AAA family ATPase [Chlorobiaceae bacterium]|nr:AAA family ATPase [Chlorobiaceae bacterium]
MKKIIIIAGPNGAGKTTFAKRFFRDEAGSIFLNADEIAESLGDVVEGRDVKAGRIMLERMDEHSRNHKSIIFETTLAARIYVDKIHAWHQSGYLVKLLFLSLGSADLAVARVAQRVIEGGHSIPEDIIRRRFLAGYDNFRNLYSSIVDVWALYDASTIPPTLIDYSHDKD